MYPLKQFVLDLAFQGRAQVSRIADFAEGDRRSAVEALRLVDQAARDEAPYEAPELSLPCALWAAAVMYRGCQGFAFRDMSQELIEEALAIPCPEPPDPSVVWSVDLTMRFLPDLRTLARGLSPADPLIVAVEKVAAQWPLSSVGVPLSGTIDIDIVMGHPCLRQLYADRILRRGDATRAGDPAVVEAIRESVGAHTQLARGLIPTQEESWKATSAETTKAP